MEGLVYVPSNLKLALSSVAKDSSSSSQPWFGPIPSTKEDDLGIDGDISDELSDDRVPVDDEFYEHSSSAFTSPGALVDLEIYDVTSRPQE